MNLKKIKTDYPKAWALLESGYGTMHSFGDGYLYYFNPDGERMQFNYHTFYDFFDDNKVPIDITPDVLIWDRPYKPNKDVVHYWFTVNFSIEDRVNYKTRTEAEAKAFEVAFGILNKRLCKQ